MRRLAGSLLCVHHLLLQVEDIPRRVVALHGFLRRGFGDAEVFSPFDLRFELLGVLCDDSADLKRFWV